MGSGAAGVGRVARADLKTEGDERAIIAERLTSIAELDAERAELLADTAIVAAATHGASDDHLVARAFRVAMQGRPGPVVVALPEDMLLEAAEVSDALRVEPADWQNELADLQTFYQKFGDRLPDEVRRQYIATAKRLGFKGC